MRTISPNDNYECKGIDVTQEEDLAELMSEVASDIEEAENDFEKMQSASEFVEAMAFLRIREGDVLVEEQMLARLADLTDATKTKFKDLYEEKQSQMQLVAEQSDDSDDISYETYPLDEFVREFCEGVTVIKSTDSNVENRYQWHFSNGAVIETQNEWVQEHLMSNNLLVNVVEGVVPIDPKADDWTHWIKTWMASNKDTEVVRGTRTVAIEELHSTLAGKVAYTEREPAAREEMCYVEDAEDYEQVEVPNTVVKRISESNALGNTAALHAELKAKGHLVQNSKTTTLPNGSQVTWWCLDPEWVDLEDIHKGGEMDEDESGAMLGGSA